MSAFSSLAKHLPFGKFFIFSLMTAAPNTRASGLSIFLELNIFVRMMLVLGSDYIKIPGLMFSEGLPASLIPYMMLHLHHWLQGFLFLAYGILGSGI